MKYVMANVQISTDPGHHLVRINMRYAVCIYILAYPCCRRVAIIAIVALKLDIKLHSEW